MTRSLAAVPSIREMEDLLAEIREAAGDGIAQAWRDVDIIARASGSVGRTAIAYQDPAGESATDDNQAEIHATLAHAARGLRTTLGQLRDVKAGLEGKVRTDRRRAEMKHSQSFTHDEANGLADEYDARKRAAHGRWAHDGTRG